jgi:hypothetical protein
MYTWSKLEYTAANCNKLANFLSLYFQQEHIVSFVDPSFSSFPIDAVREIAREQFLQEYLEDEGSFLADCQNLDRSLFGWPQTP